jgi:hypothetical protein
MREIDLDLSKDRIKAESRFHKLFTYLPKSVNANQGNAKFDSKASVLTITVPIIDDMF